MNQVQPIIYANVFRFVLYPDSLTDFSFEKVCMNLSSLGVFYACILHDRDLKGSSSELSEQEEGDKYELKKPHYHFLIISTAKRTNRQIMNLSNVKKVFCNVPRGKSINDLARYLIHIDEPINVEVPKTRYDENEIITNDFEYLQDLLKPSQIQDLSSSKTDEEILFEDLEQLHENNLSLRAFLIKHKKFIYYMPSLNALYYSMYKIYLYGDDEK